MYASDSACSPSASAFDCGASAGCACPAPRVSAVSVVQLLPSQYRNQIASPNGSGYQGSGYQPCPVGEERWSSVGEAEAAMVGDPSCPKTGGVSTYRPREGTRR